MAHIFQRGKSGKGNWYAKYYLNGKQIMKSLKTVNYRIARDRARTLETGLDPEDFENGVITPAKTSSKDRIPIKIAVEEFCKYLQGIRTENSYSKERSRLRKIFGEVCPSLEYGIFTKGEPENIIKVDLLDELTGPVIKKFLEQRRKKNLSPTTLLRDRDILHKLFEWATDYYNFRSTADPRYHNPVDAIKRPATKAPIIRYLEKPDIKNQLNVLKDYIQLKTMVAVAIYAGLRREEIVWLTRNDVDMKRKMISIRAKNIHSEYWQPKTKKNRAIPISHDLHKILKGYKPDNNIIWYFPSSTGNRWHPDTFSHKLSVINGQNSLDWTCLDFRHTFGSQLAQRGISLHKLAELMGNSPEICRRHYAAIRTEFLHTEVDFGA